MKTRWMFFIMALLGVFGSDRLGDAQDSSAPQTGLPQNNRVGDFDPFGDFELLFPAATLGLGIVDVPV